MWKAYLRADKYVLDKIQNGYLWLLDRTGIYAATVMFIIFTCQPVLKILEGVKGYNLFYGICIAIIGVQTIPLYLMQDKGDHTRYNSMAMFMEGTLLRHIFTSFQYGILLGDVVGMRPLSIIGSMCLIAFQFCWCIKIRERDKKPFFKPSEASGDLAIERGS